MVPRSEQLSCNLRPGKHSSGNLKEKIHSPATAHYNMITCTRINQHVFSRGLFFAIIKKKFKNLKSANLNDAKFITLLRTACGRRGGLVVSALYSGSRGPGSSPGRAIVLCSWARHFTLTVPLSTQECKWVPENCQGNLTECWGVTCDGLLSIPSRRSGNTPSRFMLQKPG